MEKNTQVEIINQEINRQLVNAEVGRALLATTFKGLNANSMKQAIMEGMIRGFKFDDFLKKNVYAIPFASGYSLVTSIDYARKIGAKSGIVGKDAPVYQMDGKKILSCAITVHKKVGNYVGNFTAEVYFEEFTTGRNLWSSKPRVMIAKVAEMHALRMACPEELSQTYTEEELDSEKIETAEVVPHIPMIPYTVARSVPDESDEAGGFVEKPAAESPIKYPEIDASNDGHGLEEPETPEKKEVKLRMEIAQLLKKKTGFTALGKTQEKIAEKVMDATGISYEPENYVAIIEEFKSL